jgi:hypothetical protein
MFDSCTKICETNPCAPCDRRKGFVHLPNSKSEYTLHMFFIEHILHSKIHYTNFPLRTHTYTLKVITKPQLKQEKEANLTHGTCRIYTKLYPASSLNYNSFSFNTKFALNIIYYKDSVSILVQMGATTPPYKLKTIKSEKVQDNMSKPCFLLPTRFYIIFV